MRALALGLTITLLAAAAHAEGAAYTVVDLGHLGGGTSEGVALNDDGAVVGLSRTGAVDDDGFLVQHAFLWLPAAQGSFPAGISDLGTLGGADDHSEARDVNGALTIVGRSETGMSDDFGSLIEAFLLRDGTFEPLPPLGFRFASLNAVNESGQAVGLASSGLGCRPQIWLPSADLGLPAGWSALPMPLGRSEGEAFDINERGEVVGFWTEACDVGHRRPFLWLPEAAYGLESGSHELFEGYPLIDLAWASAISDDGWIVGYLFAPDGRIHSWAWKDGRHYLVLGLPAAVWNVVEGVNDDGLMVGTTGLRAVLWVDGLPVDLNTRIDPDSGWNLATARAINARGEIVGTGLLGDELRAFLLRPRQKVPAGSSAQEAGKGEPADR